MLCRYKDRNGVEDEGEVGVNVPLVLYTKGKQNERTERQNDPRRYSPEIVD